MFIVAYNHFTGGLDMGVFDGCMVAEELAFGCTGIMTAMEASGLGVSGASYIDRPCDSLEIHLRQI